MVHLSFIGSPQQTGTHPHPQASSTTTTNPQSAHSSFFFAAFFFALPAFFAAMPIPPDSFIILKMSILLIVLDYINIAANLAKFMAGGP
jgi:hypothetical protein